MSAEGVPVAWAVMPADADTISTFTYDEASARHLVTIWDRPFPVGSSFTESKPYRVVPLYPHPAAASAEREAAYKALLAFAECEDAYKKANQSNDWMVPLTDAGWGGKSDPRAFINALRAHALSAARAVDGKS